MAIEQWVKARTWTIELPEKNDISALFISTSSARIIFDGKPRRGYLMKFASTG
jgi:hypothetical protein